ncbi:hypothetical protein AB4865_06810 [Capnocytophaga sp. ARDL2]|uniref:hypothetical protein n=1 Tax=Capnocytophaga sp. ARDL2 TaxID=3238809 RepID=UPI003556D6D7
MDIIRFLIFTLYFPFILNSQKTNVEDMYSYQTPYYYESISLLKNGQFIYKNNTNFLSLKIEGKWEIKNDSILILNSDIKNDKIKVVESIKKDKKHIFKVRNTNDYYFVYEIYLINNKGDTIVMKNQFDKTNIIGNFSSFYIVDTRGLKSPTYKIINENANFFEITIEQKRFFDNEIWKFHHDYIIPLGIDEKYTNYKLYKTNH